MKKALPLRGKAFSFVGVAGFEPATLWSQTRCANRAALHPENFESQKYHNFSDFIVYHKKIVNYKTGRIKQNLTASNSI